MQYGRLLLAGLFLLVRSSEGVGQMVDSVNVWYLSQSGKNNAFCGASSETPCGTFEYLVHNFCNASFIGNFTVWTDVSIEITPTTLDECRYLASSYITFVNNENSNLVLLKLNEVRMIESLWEITGISVEIVQSDLSHVGLFLNSVHGIEYIIVQNSSLGSIKTGPGYKVTVLDSYIDGKFRYQGSLFVLENSQLNLTNTKFVNNFAVNSSVILNAKNNSSIVIRNCVFLNNSGEMSIIEASEETWINVINSEFRNNVVTKNMHSLLSINNSSSVHVTNSIFIDNFAPTGGVFRIIRSNVRVESSNFLNNTAFSVGVCYLQNSTLISTDSSYLGNTASNDVARSKHSLPDKCLVGCIVNCDGEFGSCLDQLQTSGVYFAKDFSYLTVKNDTYKGNVARISGGLMTFGNVSIDMQDSIVSHTLTNSILDGGYSNITFTNMMFTQNSKSNLLLFENCHVVVQDSQFVENLGKLSCILIVGGTLFVERSIFLRNTLLIERGGPIYTINSTVTVRFSEFLSNTGSIMGEQSQVFVSDCSFGNNKKLVMVMVRGQVHIAGTNFIGELYNQNYFFSHFSEWVVQNCTFSNITSQSMFLFSQSSVYIDKNFFTRNLINNIFQGVQIKLVMRHCNFVENNVLRNIFDMHSSDFNLSKSLFDGNTHGITNLHNSSAFFQNIKVSNTTTVAERCSPLFTVLATSSLRVTDSIFSFNSGIIEAEQRSFAVFRGCKFLDSYCESLRCSIILASKSNTSIDVQFCHFSHNGFPEVTTCILVGAVHGILKIHGSTFTNNKAAAVSGEGVRLDIRNSSFETYVGSGTFISLTGGNGTFENLSFLSNASNINWVSIADSMLSIVNSTFNHAFPSPPLDFYPNSFITMARSFVSLYGIVLTSNIREVYPKTGANQFLRSPVMLFIEDSVLRTTFTEFNNVTLSVNNKKSTLRFLTWHTLFVSPESQVSSNDSKAFLEDAQKQRFIQFPELKGPIVHTETVYASVKNLPCGDNYCNCYYSAIQNYNVTHCSKFGISQLPVSLVNYTDSLILENGDYSKLCGGPDISNLQSLTVMNTNVGEICENFVQRMTQSKLSYLDLSSNKLARLPEIIKSMRNLKTLKISQNALTCDCTMTWMTEWLVNSTSFSGQRFIVDYENVTCHGGKMIGNPIYQLDSGEMGCHDFALWKIVTIAMVGVLVVVTVILATVIIKRSNEVRWLIYKNFNKLIQRERNEEIANYEYEFDAFVCYSHEDYNLIRPIMMNNNNPHDLYLETEHGFMLCLHRRNFLGGVTIINNIVNAVEKSRRSIMFLTRNFTSAQWCMEEFYLCHNKVMTNNPNYLIPVLMEELDVDNLPRDLQTYLRTHTYIDAREFDHETLRKRIRFSMPHEPLEKLRIENQKNQQNQQNPENENIPMERMNKRAVRILQHDGSVLEFNRLDPAQYDNVSDSEATDCSEDEADENGLM